MKITICFDETEQEDSRCSICGCEARKKGFMFQADGEACCDICASEKCIEIFFFFDAAIRWMGLVAAVDEEEFRRLVAMDPSQTFDRLKRSMHKLSLVLN